MKGKVKGNGKREIRKGNEAYLMRAEGDELEDAHDRAEGGFVENKIVFYKLPMYMSVMIPP